MPVVPTINTPSVAASGTPGATYQTPSRFIAESQVPGEQLGKLGAGMMKAGDEFMAEATRQQVNLNEAAAKDYDTKLMGGIQAILYGTPDAPDSGYLNAKGKTAIDSFDAAAQAINKLPADLSKDLTNPAQGELVKTIAQQRVQSAIVHATTHRGQQSDVYAKSTGELRMKTAQDGAALAYNPISDTPAFDAANDASPYQQYLRTVRAEATELATRNGITEQQDVDAFTRNAVAKAYTGTLAHLIDRKGGNTADLKTAKTFFDAVKGELPAADQDKVRAVLEAGSQKDEALSLALKVKAETPGIAKQEKALDDMFAAGDIKAEVHSMALQHLRADNAQRRSEEAEGDRWLRGQAWDAARNGKTLGDMPPSFIAAIKARGIGPEVDSIFKRGDKAAPIDDTKLWTDLMHQVGEDPSGFAALDLSKLAPQLGDAHYDYLVKTQASMSRKDLKAFDSQKLLKDTVSATRAQMLAAGINLSPKPGTDAAKQLDQFNSSLYDALTTAQDVWAEKKLTRPQMHEEARSIALGMLKDQALSGSGYFGTSIGQTHMPVWKMTQEQRAAPWDIPAVDRQQIVQSLQRANQPTTEDAIQRVYKASRGLR